MIRIYLDSYNEQELQSLHHMLNHNKNALESVCDHKCDNCKVKVLCTSLTSTVTFLERKLEVTK